jgi:hypothetical protein
VAHHLLAPRIPSCQVVAVESINDDGGQRATTRGRQFAELHDNLHTVSDVVVDVGASNVEDLLALMRGYTGNHEDSDGFVVPTVPARKQQQDTAATLAELARIGVPPARLRLVFNQVEDDRPLERVFETLLAFARAPTVEPRGAACMRQNEVYARIRQRESRCSSWLRTRAITRPRSPRLRQPTNWRRLRSWRLSGWPAGSFRNSMRASRRWTCSPAWRASRRERC